MTVSAGASDHQSSMLHQQRGTTLLNISLTQPQSANHGNKAFTSELRSHPFHPNNWQGSPHHTTTTTGSLSVMADSSGQKTPRFRDDQHAILPLGGLENRDQERISPRVYKGKFTPDATPITPCVTPASPYYADQTYTDATKRLSRDESTGTWAFRGRVDSAVSRSSSRQSHYHDNCTPRLDPTLVIGSRSRREYFLAKQRESEELLNRRNRRRPHSWVAARLQGPRESVSNFVYAGREEVFEDEREEDKQETLLKNYRSQSVCSRMMASPSVYGDETFHERDYDVVEEDMHSLPRGSPAPW